MDISLTRLSSPSIKSLEDYCKRILTAHRNYSEPRNKFEFIDTNYYRYQTESDREAGDQSCGVTIDNMVIPIVISQVDSFVGYLGEVYLSGYPTFPVVSSPATAPVADKMEAIIDTHATLGQYSRHFLKGFRCGIKYNFMPILCEWDEIPSYSLVSQALDTTNANKLEQAEKGYTCVKALDPYNTIWDYRFSPAEVSIRGDFVGYADRISRAELKTILNKLSKKRIGYNGNVISQLPSNVGLPGNYRDPPIVSQYITVSQSKMDWDQWLGLPGSQNQNQQLNKSMYELAYLYLRLIPSDYGINAPNPNSPQIFKVWFLNGERIIGFDRVLSPYQAFPIHIGMPIEDNFKLQTPSIAESQAGYQIAASTLFDIRIQSARRAVMDRALFDSDMINPAHVNSTHPTAKIPVKMKGLQDKKIQDAYFPIPFQSSGLEGVIGNIRDIMQFSDLGSGLNAPQRGQFQKGNKSVEEWRDTMGSADNRLRLPALNVEFQSMIPIKENIKFNIFLKGEAGTYTNMKKGENTQVTSEDLSAMQSLALSFRIADGYTPKSKMASTDGVMTLIQTIGQSQILAQSLGPMLPQMVAHLAQLIGIRDLNQYVPQQQVQQVQQPPVV